MSHVLTLLISTALAFAQAQPAPEGGSSTGGGSSRSAQEYLGIHLPENSESGIGRDKAEVRRQFYLAGMAGLHKLDTFFYAGGKPEKFTTAELQKAKQVLRDVYDEKNGKRFALDPELRGADGKPLAATNSADGLITVNPNEYFININREHAPGVANQLREVIAVHEIMSQPELARESTGNYAVSSHIFQLEANLPLWDKVLPDSWATSVVKSDRALYAIAYKKVYRSSDDGISWSEIAAAQATGKGIAVGAASSRSELFLGTFGEGVFRLKERGGQFSLEAMGLGGKSVEKLSFSADGRLLAGHWGNASGLSAYSGGEWGDVSPYPATSPSGYKSNIQSLNAMSDGTVIIGMHGDNGVYVSQGVFGEKIRVLSARAELTAVTVDSSDRLWVATRENYATGNFWVSSDKGASWTSLPTASIFFKYLAVNKKGFVAAATSRGEIHYSVDAGKSWKKVNLALQFPMLNLIENISISETGYLMVITDYEGVFRSHLPLDKL